MKLAAVIIETRPLSGLVNLIQKHLDMLPPDTVLFVPRLNKELSNAFPKCEVVYCGEQMDEVRYNALMTSPSFWRHFTDSRLGTFDRVLVFQHDSMLLRTGIEEFYPYDYVGAPWKFQNHGGNGGLSLRNPDTMLKICLLHKWSSDQGNEDVWFSNLMHKYKMESLAPREVAEKFSCESIFSLGTLGYHAIDKWLSDVECEQIKNQYHHNNNS
jgi:hypothetical protein